MRGITESRPLGQFAGEIWTDNFNDWTIMYIMRYCLAKYLNRKNLQEMNIQKIDLWRERDWNTSRVYEMFANTLSDDESEMSKLPMMQIVYNAFMQQNETHSSKNQFDISGNIVHSTLLEHGWEELNNNSYPIEQYLSKETRNITQVFINKKFEKCFIICNKTPTETWMSRLLSSLIKIFSWCFGEQYTQEELNIFKLLSQKEYDQAVELIDADFANLDVEKKINEMFLSKYGSLQIKSRICILEDKIETVHRKIAEYQNSISTKLVELEDCKFDLNTLLNTETDDTQIVNFFTNRKNITIDQIEIGARPKIYYHITETIEFYNPDIIRTSIDNYLSNHSNSSTQRAYFKKIFEGLFIKELGKIETISEFCLQSVTALNAIKYTESSQHVDYTRALPHPHLGNYACLGGNENEISKALMNGDWDLAIDQTISATKNWDFGDGAVMNRVLEYFSSHSGGEYKFVICNNGERMTLNEFYNYLVSLEQAENNVVNQGENNE